MPGNKSRRNRVKYSNKRQGEATQVAPAGLPQPGALAPQAAPASASPRVSPSPARGAASAAKAIGGRDYFVVSELRTIGILVAIMLILLVVLARVFA